MGRQQRHHRRARTSTQRDRPLFQHLQGPRAGQVDRGRGFRRPRQRAGRARVMPERLSRPRGGAREEVETTVDRYHELRRRIDEGREPDAFGALADFYTDDAVYIDGAWGRLEGRDTIAPWLGGSMLGMEDWKFPIEFTAIEGNDVVVKWTQIMPRTRPDGTPYRQSGYSRLIYAGNGKFSYEEDMYNMAHVLEDITASGWQPNGPM